MARRVAAALGAGLVVAASSGCTLLNLDKYPLPGCRTDDDCAPLNAYYGLASGACEAFQCRARSATDGVGVCRREVLDRDGDGDPDPSCGGHDCDDRDALRAGAGDRARETCDGVDNDCNGTIDDGVIRPRNLETAVSDVPSIGAPAYSVVSGGRVAAAYNFRDATTGAFSLLRPGTPAGPPPQALELGYATQTAASYPLAPVLTTATPNCWSVASGMPALDTCRYRDVAVAGVAQGEAEWFVVGLNTSGCDRGQLRAGVMALDGAQARRTVLLGPAALSNVYQGIDLDPVSRCTGPGAQSPALASLAASGGAPQALAAWLSAPVSRARCSGAVDVRALGLWRESYVQASTWRFVSATGNGVPRTLGRTGSSRRPAALGLGGSGYLVAFGNPDAGVDVVFAPPFPEPPSFDVTMAQASPAVSRSTQDFASQAAVQVVADQAGVEQVALGAGVTLGGVTEVAVAATSGCAEPSRLQLVRVSVDPSRTPAVTRVGSAITLAARAASSPSVVWVSRGFVQPGTRRGSVTVTLETSGGWLVAWQDGSGAAPKIVGIRVSAADFTPVDGSPFVLSDASGGVRDVQLVAPAAETPGVVGAVFVDPGSTRIAGAQVLCAPTR